MDLPTEKPRLLEAVRNQLELRPSDLESLLPEDHQARMVWALVEKLDLERFKVGIKARGSKAGRPAIDPKILVALWIQGTLDGIGSARELARRCEHDNVYRWLRGGVEVSYHVLSDFRVGHPGAVDELLTQLIAGMANQGLINLDRVAQDGTRVRASAGNSSFRRRPTLLKCYEEAKARVEELKKQANEPDGTLTARQRAARERAAGERMKQVEEALRQLPVLEALKRRDPKRNTKKRSEARISTTDPDARVMKVANGGFEPALNVQFAAETQGRVIVGVRVTNEGADAAQAAPMIEHEIVRRTGRMPREYLMDGGFTNRDSVQELADKGIVVFGGLQRPRDPAQDPHEPKRDDTPAYAELRKRMKLEESKTIYKERGAVIETVNADVRQHRNLRAFLVRGLAKTLSVALWAAISYNALRWLSLTNGHLS